MLTKTLDATGADWTLCRLLDAVAHEHLTTGDIEVFIAASDGAYTAQGDDLDEVILQLEDGRTDYISIRWSDGERALRLSHDAVTTRITVAGNSRLRVETLTAAVEHDCVQYLSATDSQPSAFTTDQPISVSEADRHLPGRSVRIETATECADHVIFAIADLQRLGRLLEFALQELPTKPHLKVDLALGPYSIYHGGINNTLEDWDLMQSDQISWIRFSQEVPRSHIQLSLTLVQDTRRFPGDSNRLTVAGTNVTWVHGTAATIKHFFAILQPQPKVRRWHIGLIFIATLLASMAVYCSLLYRTNEHTIHELLYHKPYLIVPITPMFYASLAVAATGVILSTGLLSAVFARRLRDLFPRIEFRSAAQHFNRPQQQRRRLAAWGTILVIPFLISLAFFLI